MIRLSRKEIERIGLQVFEGYKRAVGGNIQSIELNAMLWLLGLRKESRILSKDRSVLGMSAFTDMWVEVFDHQDEYYHMDGNTILIDSRFEDEWKYSGRYSFTCMHEIAHQLLARTFPAAYRLPANLHCYKTHRSEGNWEEWQADALSACLLMPKELVIQGMRKWNIPIPLYEGLYTDNWEDWEKLSDLA